LLVEADHRVLGVVGLGVQVEHILHGCERRAHLWDAPALAQPGRQPLFVSTRRTVSSEMPPTTPRCTSSSASSCIDQAVRPSGGLAQASATSTASRIQHRLGTRARSLHKRGFEAFLDEAMPNPFGRRAVGVQRSRDLLVGVPLVGQ
jgi:hypothetical protein